MRKIDTLAFFIKSQPRRRAASYDSSERGRQRERKRERGRQDSACNKISLSCFSDAAA